MKKFILIFVAAIMLSSTPMAIAQTISGESIEVGRFKKKGDNPTTGKPGMPAYSPILYQILA